MREEDVRRLIAEARAEARDDVRALLRKRFAAELLEAAEAELSGRGPAPAAAPPIPHGETVLWVYGVSDAGATDPPDDLRGIDGAAVRAIRHAGVSAFASEVPHRRFSAGALTEQLEDLARVEALARAHERVVETMREEAAVVPCRLCTIYASEPSLQEMLEREHAGLQETLVRLHDAAEWGVKLIHTGAAAPPRREAASGADYIAAKRDARREAEQALETLDSIAAEVHARIAEHADAAVVNRAQDRRLSGHEGEMLLNAAYLVPHGRTEAFRSVVEELAERHDADGLTFELTGPWAPYHFAGEVPQA